MDPCPTPSTKFQLQILPVTLDDIPAISDIHLRAWLTNAIYATIYYGGYSETLFSANIARHTNALQNDPSSCYLKCVSDNQLIAWAKINIFSNFEEVNARKDTGERIWPPGINLALVSLFWGQLQKLRAVYGTKLGPHVQVDLVATDPHYFRRGAGKALMNEIVRIADEENLPCFIEGSPDGQKLYASVGFVKVGEFSVDIARFPGGQDLGEDWRDKDSELATPEKGLYRQFVMIRPAKGQTVADYLGNRWDKEMGCS